MFTVAAALVVMQQVTLLDRCRVYRIGYGDRPPMYLLTEDKSKPSGFAVEVLNEAARREKIRLEWVHGGQKGFDDAFAKGTVHLTPFTIVLPERSKKGLVFTESWWSDNHVVVTDLSTGIRDRNSLKGRRVGFNMGRMRPPRDLLPEGVIPVNSHDSQIAMDQLCRGLTEAAVVQRSYFESLALDRTPACSEAKLTQIGDLSFDVEVAIASMPDSARVAKALRRQIDRMVEDGTLASLAGNWMPISSREINLGRHLNQVQNRTATLERALLALFLLMLFGIREIVHTRKLRRIAEQASAVKDEFLANMSHEFRTPMNAVLGLTQLSLEGKLETESRHNLELVYAAAKNLRVMIDDLFDFGELAQKKLQLQCAPFSLRELTESLVSGISIEAAKRQIEILVTVGDGVPALVRGDELRVRQVLHNLLSNALKFTEKGEICLTIDALEAPRHEDVSREGHRIVFTVRDTGIGIPQEKLSKIFELFTQVDSSSRRQYGGTGLGLAVTDGLVRLMGGKIEVSSVLGAGTTFRVLCRLGTVREQDSSAEGLVNLHRFVEGSLATTRHPLTAPSILIVHGNPTARVLIAQQVKASGWTACSAGSVDAAMRVVHHRNATFDALLVESSLDDQKLPLRQRLRSEWLEPKLIIELHEALCPSERSPRQGPHVSGCAVCLVKPNFQEPLQRVLDQFVCNVLGSPDAIHLPAAEH
jgi:signal transduction histidine kinase